MKTIVKYSNRKLYDLNNSQYCTLTDIIDDIKRGQPIQVVRHDDQKDITVEVLKNCLVQLNLSKNSLINIITFTN